MKKVISFLIAMILLILPLNIAEAKTPKPYSKGEKGIVCLTFDDGYGRNNITKILDVLREKDVKCTFFVIGSQLRNLADLWRQAIRDGHEICYHSMNHSYMSKKSNAFIKKDIERWYNTAREVLGDSYQLLNIVRLPGGSGHRSGRVMGLYTGAGYKVVGWTTDTMGGVTAKSKRNTNTRIKNYILRTTHENTIILTHFDKYNANALPYYIDELKARFKLGKVSEAIAAAGPAPGYEPTVIETPSPTPSLEPVLPPDQSGPPETSQTPEATPSAEPSITPEPSMEPTPSLEPTPAPTPDPSTAPSPPPTGTPEEPVPSGSTPSALLQTFMIWFGVA